MFWRNNISKDMVKWMITDKIDNKDQEDLNKEVTLDKT